MPRKLLATGAASLALIAGSATAAQAKVAGIWAAKQSAVHSIASPQCRRGYYKNVNGVCIHRPGHDPTGATAKCRDGTYSYSRHASGTCSHHGGVLRWIHHP